MSAKHALLGLLLDRPAYPYQLTSRLQGRLGPAWEVNSGQLYQTVKALEKDGLIERVRSAASGRQERQHVFRITDAGVTELERFFEEEPERIRLSRRPLLLKITFAGPQRLSEAQAKLDSYERECALALKEISGRREQISSDGALLHAERLLLRLNLSADVFQLEGELRWARHAREMLSWLASSEALWPSQLRNGTQEEARQQAGEARQEMFRRMAGTPEAKDGEDANAADDERKRAL